MSIYFNYKQPELITRCTFCNEEIWEDEEVIKPTHSDELFCDLNCYTDYLLSTDQYRKVTARKKTREDFE